MSHTTRLYSEIHSTESNIRNYEKQNTNTQHKIECLRSTKNEIKGIKKDVKAQEKRTNKMSKGLKDWKGSNYSEYREQINNELAEAYEQYCNGLNNLLDSVDDEISRLRNESYQLDSNIGFLIKRLNWLYSELKTVLKGDGNV